MYFIITLALLITLSSCAIPGSTLVNYKLHGKVTESEPKSFDNKIEVKTVLPGSHGLSPTEFFMAPFEKDKTENIEINNKGEFVSEQSTVMHSSFFIIPPIGWVPKIAHPPNYLVGARKGECSRLWRVQYDKFNYQVYSASEDEFVDVPKNRQELSGSARSCEGKEKFCSNNREVDLEIKWDSQAYCNSKDQELMKRNLAKTLSSHELYLSYGELIENAGGVSYEYSFDRLGVFKLNVPIGFADNITAIGVLGQVSLINFGKLRLHIGMGKSYVTDYWNNNSQISLRYSFTKKMHAVFGWASSYGESQDRIGNYYLKLGWRF